MYKVVFLLRSFNAGGIERVLINLINELYLSYSIYVVVVKNEGDLKSSILIPKEKIIDLGGMRLLKSVIPLCKALDSINPDVLITGGDIPNCIAVICKFLCKNKFKTIISQHNYANSEANYFKLLKHAISFLYKRSDSVIAVSQGIEDFLKEYLKVKKNKISLIYNPIDVDECVEKSHQQINNLNIENYLLFCGRLTSVKNLSFMIEAFALLKEKDLNLVICGDGPELEKLISFATEKKIKSNVHFIGSVENVFPWIRGSLYCLMSSTSEAFPMFVLESFALNKLMVSTPTKGYLEIANDDISFSSTSIEDISSYVNMMRLALEKKNDEKIIKKIKCRISDFNKASIVNQYSILINSICEKD